MSGTLVTQLQKQSNLKGYKPRVGVFIEGMLASYAFGDSFDVVLDSGTDGVTNSVADDERFDSAAMTNTGFIAGDILSIIGGANDGEYTITAPQEAANAILCNSAGFTTGTGQTWKVTRRFLDTLSSGPNFNLMTKITGGMGTLSNVQLGIPNQELYSNILATYANPENMALQCALYFDDGSAILDAESHQFYEGIISDFPSLNYKTVKFNVDGYDRSLNNVIGELVEEADATANYVLPDLSHGMIKPIIYGDRRSFRNATSNVGITATEWDANTDVNMVPCVALGNDYWLISGHAIKTFSAAAGDKMFAFDEILGRYVELLAGDFTIISNTASGCVVRRNTSRYVDTRYPVSATDQFADVSWANTANLVDNDISTKADVTISNPGEIAHLDLVWPPDDISADVGTKTDARINVRCEGDFDGISANLYFENDPTNLIVSGGAMTYFDTNNKSLGAAFDTTSVKFESLAAGSFDADLYACYLQVQYTAATGREAAMPLFFGGRGRCYGTWVNSRTGTETHADNGGGSAHPGVGTLIENPAGVVESLLRDELSVATANINLDAFNVASNDLSSDVDSFHIVESLPWLELLDEVAFSAKSILHIDADDKFKMVTLVTGNNFTAGGTVKPSSEDIFEFSPENTFVITTGFNDSIWYAGTEYTISAGQYTGATLAAAIGAFSGAITCTYSSTTGKFTLTDVVGLGGVVINWTNGTNVGRFIGFDISANDTIADSSTIVSDFPLWADSFVENPIVENSFSLRKEGDVMTDFTVEYAPDPTAGLTKSTNVTDTTYHSESLKGSWEHNFTRDKTTADSLRDNIKTRKNRKHFECIFKTFLNAINVEMFDIINVRHPILEGIFTEATMNDKKWVVLKLVYNWKSFDVTITAVEA